MTPAGFWKFKPGRTYLLCQTHVSQSRVRQVTALEDRSHAFSQRFQTPNAEIEDLGVDGQECWRKEES